MSLRRSLAFLAVAALAGALHAEEAAPPDPTPKLAQGQMVKYGDKLVFAPCRDPSYVLLEDVSGDGRVLAALDMVGLSAGKKLYVEVLGVADDNALKATQVNFAQTEGRCQLPGGREESWRASGSEPGWVLAVGDEVVQLKRPGQPDVVVPAAPLTPENGLATFAASSDKQKLALRFEQKLCRDAAANAVFGWTATVRVNDRELKGCAWQR